MWRSSSARREYLSKHTRLTDRVQMRVALSRRERVAVMRGGDTLQLGADVVLDGDGRIAFPHLAVDTADRTPPEELIAVLLDGAPAQSMAREMRAVG